MPVPRRPCAFCPPGAGKGSEEPVSRHARPQPTGTAGHGVGTARHRARGRHTAQATAQLSPGCGEAAEDTGNNQDGAGTRGAGTGETEARD